MAEPSRSSAPIADTWRAHAQKRSDAAGERLTPARLDAYAELLATERPVTAYELIALLEARNDKKIAPLTVYRHLDFLIKVGLAHRLESTNSYVACDHPGHTQETQYLLCSSCGNADEVESDSLRTLLHEISDHRGFQLEDAVIEVRGRCADCVDDDVD